MNSSTVAIIVRTFVFALALFSSIPVSAQIQVENGFSVPPLGSDTLCFSYQFEQGDTLLYSIESADSVKFLGDEILTKKRYESLVVICDSVLPGGLFALRFVVDSAMERQFTATDTIVRTSSPWIGRQVWVVIDSMGNREAVNVDSPSRAVLAPGGAFQPILFPTLGESCGVQNQSWLVEDTIALVENGIPPPAFSHQTLWRVVDDVDTLGKTFSQIQYTQTGIGSVTIETPTTSFTMVGVIAGYGKLSFLRGINVPYHFFAASHDRIEVKTPNGGTKKGVHRVASHMRLLEIRSPLPGRSMIVGLEP